VATRGHSATLAALRQARQGAKDVWTTDVRRGDAVVFAKGKRRTLKIVDAGKAIRALRSHGAGDDALLETGDSTDEALRDGEVSIGSFMRPVEGLSAETVGGSGS